MRISKIENQDNKTKDHRFISDRFKVAVRLVLIELFGLEPNHGNFRRVETAFHGVGTFGWIETAYRIDHPRYFIKVWVLDARGDRTGAWHTEIIEAEARPEALAQIDTKWFEIFEEGA